MIRLLAVRPWAACLSIFLLSSSVPLSAVSAVSTEAETSYQKGAAFMMGEGVPKDLAQAKSLLMQSAEQGHVEAQVLLGRLHYFMPGEVDLDKTLYWWNQAARQGHARAQYQLSILYLKHAGPNPLEASAWMHIAQENGDPRADQVLPKMEEQFEVDKRALAKRISELKSEMGIQVAQDAVEPGPQIDTLPVSVESAENVSESKPDLADVQAETSSPAERADDTLSAVAAEVQQVPETETLVDQRNNAATASSEQVVALSEHDAGQTSGSAELSQTPVNEPGPEAVASDTEGFPAGYYVQLASVNDEAGAESFARKVAAKQSEVLGEFRPRVNFLRDKGSYKIWVGAFAGRSEATGLCESLQAHKQDCFVVRW